MPGVSSHFRDNLRVFNTNHACELLFRAFEHDPMLN